MAEHYTLKAGVVLSITIKAKVKKIADKYYALTKKDIVVTSGARSSQSQASAMYGKLSGGDQLTVYSNQTAAKEIKKSYTDAVAAKKSKADTIAAMKAVIDTQISKMIYISKHLKTGAVDVRSKNMTVAEKAHLKSAATGIAIKIILETTPPHFHLSL